MGNVWNTSFGAGSNHSSVGPGAGGGGDSASNTLTSHSRTRPRESEKLMEDEEVEELSPRRLDMYFLRT